MREPGAVREMIIEPLMKSLWRLEKSLKLFTGSVPFFPYLTCQGHPGPAPLVGEYRSGGCGRWQCATPREKFDKLFMNYGVPIDITLAQTLITIGLNILLVSIVVGSDGGILMPKPPRT